MCPTCRATGRDAPPLELGPVAREGDGDILEGALLCPARACRREHPIIDGIPIVVADIRSYVSHQLPAIQLRDDLSPYIDSLLGDCAGAGSDHDRARSQLSSYARGHYGDCDPDEPEGTACDLAALLARGLSLIDGAAAAAQTGPAPPSGEPPRSNATMWLDVGCALGRTAFELTARADLVVGVDLSFAMLRAARHVAVTGELTYARRRVGVVYDRRTVKYPRATRDRAVFWACDAMALPFADGAFAGAASLNVVDCVSSPLAHLVELGRVVRPGGHALIATPYDWAASATPMEGWLGGHSQRAEQRGSSAAEMRRVLSDESPTEPPIRLRAVAEDDAAPWRVYVHERATMTYRVHLIAARAV